MAHRQTRVVLATFALILFHATTASSGISLDAAPAAPGSSDVVLRWESSAPGSFRLLKRDLGPGQRPSTVLPLDPVTDLVASDVTSPLLLSDAASPALPAGITLYQVLDASGGCSNVGAVLRIEPLMSTTGCAAVHLALPWRNVYRDARALLEHLPSVESVRVFDLAACRDASLSRGPGGTYLGDNGFIRPGQGVVLIVTDARPVVVVGASEPSARALPMPDNTTCRPARQLLAFPLGATEADSFDLLCGVGWPDANGDLVPDRCTGGFYADRRTRTFLELPANSVTGPIELTHGIVIGSSFGTTYGGARFETVPGVPVYLDNVSHVAPQRAFLPADVAAPAACRCLDGDADGDDDCTEILHRTDPADPSSRGPDSDGDGVLDDADNCPTIFDPIAADSDGDGAGDACDSCATDPLDVCDDADGDGVGRGSDNCELVPNPLQGDQDIDGRGDHCDNCVLSDNPCQEDANGDGLGDACDRDIDGVPDWYDICADVSDPGQDDGDGDEVGDACDACPTEPGSDPDGDGVCQADDNCPGASNPAQDDVNGDGVGDACDWDADGVPDTEDNCQFIANTDQVNSDWDWYGDACDSCPADLNNDADWDDVCSDADNCPWVANSQQEDDDGNGVGNACDRDGDGVDDVPDNCDLVANPDQADADGDRVGDACDACPLDGFRDDGDLLCAPADNCPGVSNADQGDADADGAGDPCDNCPPLSNADQLDVLPRDGVGDACAAAVPHGCCLPEVERHTSFLFDSSRAHPTWLAADDLGGVHLLSTPDLWAAPWQRPQLLSSFDDGRTWEASRPLVPTSFMAASADRSGGLVIAYAGVNAVMSIASFDQGRTFSAPQVVGFGSASPKRMRVRLDRGPADRVAATWVDADNPNTSAIGIAVSADRGRSWGPAAIVRRDLPRQVSVHSVAVTEEAVVIGWTQEPSNSVPWEAVAIRSTDLGATWSAPTSVSTGPARFVVLATTSGGHVQAVIQAGTNLSELRVGVSLDSGASWTGVEASIGLGSGIMGVSTQPSGDVVVMWRGYWLQSSGGHGLPGTWLGSPVRLSPASDLIDEITVLSSAPGVIDVLHSDYRVGIREESVFLAHSCDRGATWPYLEPRLDIDTPGFNAHSEAGYPPAVGRDGRLHAMWPNAYVNPIHYEYVSMRVPDRARIDVTPLPPCERASHRLELDPGDVTNCTSTSITWLMDGSVIPGATDAVYEVPVDAPEGSHSFEGVVTCDGAIRCGSVSAQVTIDIVPPDGPVNETDIAGLLFVAKEGSGLVLRWQERALPPTGHSIYAGTIESLEKRAEYDHQGLHCRVARVPVDALDFVLPSPMPQVDTYYLVSPADCQNEGLVGSSSLQVRRPIAGVGVACGPMDP